MTCDPCADLSQVKYWLAKLLEFNGIAPADALKLETQGYLLLEDGSYLLLEA